MFRRDKCLVNVLSNGVGIGWFSFDVDGSVWVSVFGHVLRPRVSGEVVRWSDSEQDAYEYVSYITDSYSVELCDPDFGPDLIVLFYLFSLGAEGDAPWFGYKYDDY